MDPLTALAAIKKGVTAGKRLHNLSKEIAGFLPIRSCGRYAVKSSRSARQQSDRLRPKEKNFRKM